MWMIAAPYVVLVFFYMVVFKVYQPKPPPGTILSAIFKCLPILYLILLLVIAPKLDNTHDAYRNAIVLALVFSICGDWFLNWMGNYFIPGLACFALAQITYIFAFGMSPFAVKTAMAYGGAAVAFMAILLPDTRPPNIRPVVGVYICLLNLMGWRATAKYTTDNATESFTAMVGALFFCVSDFLIGFNRWKVRFSRAVFYIMLSYYIAQILIAFSVIIPIWNALQKARFMGV